MKNFFNQELFLRILSVLVFIPIVILPLLLSNFIAVLLYLIILSIILIEINEMKKKVNKAYIFNLYSLISIISFFLFLFLLITKKNNELLIIMIIMVIWLFDTFSYIGGKIIGGKKLMPNISSGKTVSGLVTGVLSTLFCIGIIFIWFGQFLNISIFITILTIILSFTGDTLVSLLKRYARIKDSGSIMPGHGGLLDRFDSFIMVFFIFGICNTLI